MKNIESDGLQLNPNAPSAPVPGQVQNVSCGAVRDGGGRVITWSKVPGATAYEAQTTTMPGVSSAWALAGKIKGSRWRCPLLAEPEVWMRVRALGVAGPGPWSDPVLIKSRSASARMAA
jgi:hypothetical protein